MSEETEPDHPTVERPSLTQTVLRALRRRLPTAIRPSPAWRTTLATVMLAATAASLLTALAAFLQAASIERAAAGRPDPRGDATRAEAIGLMRLYAAPGMNAELRILAAHLPGGVRLASAAKGEDGLLRFSVLTPDPDQLRDELRREPWFARFAEIRQGIGPDGRIEMTLEQRR